MSSNFGIIDVIGLTPGVLAVAWTIVVNLFTAIFRGPSGRPSYFREVFNAAIRKAYLRLELRQLLYLQDSTEVVYTRYCTSSKPEIKPEWEDLEPGGRLFWLGKKNTEGVVLFFLHGGGFVGHATEGQFGLFSWLKEEVAKEGLSLDGVFLDYSLAPSSPYPSQLKQATAALQFLLDNGYDPSRIIIAGDSAGGGLALSLLYHLLHQHPDLPAPPSIASPFRGLLLISPWVEMNPKSTSVDQFSNTDYLTPAALEKMGRAYIGTSKSGGWRFALEADEGSWSDLERLVTRVFVVAGDEEILRDSIVKFHSVLQREVSTKTKVDLYVAKRETHDEMEINFIMGWDVESGSSTDVIGSWVRETVRAQ